MKKFDHIQIPDDSDSGGLVNAALSLVAAAVVALTLILFALAKT